MCDRGLAEAADFTFIQAEGEALKNIVGGWFGNFFWIFGTLSLLPYHSASPHLHHGFA